MSNYGINCAFVALVLALTFVPAARAASAEEVAAKFAAADTNADGKLTPEEAKAMPRIAKNFKKLDSEAKGYLTLEQIQAAAAR